VEARSASNVRITCGLWLARPWQPRAIVSPSMRFCQGRDGPARQVNAAVRHVPLTCKELEPRPKIGASWASKYRTG
jgi:hypothetical protein